MHEEPARHDAHWTLPLAGSRQLAVARGLAAAPQTYAPQAAAPGWTGTAVPAPSESSAGSYILRQFQTLTDEHAALKRELARSCERLNTVLEVSQELSSCDDPAAMEADLLRRYAGNLATAALFLDRDGRCSTVSTGEDGVSPLAVTAAEIRDRLAIDIDVVRRTQRARDLTLAQALERGLGNVYVLLSPLQADAQRPHVVVALRNSQQQPFGRDDRIASETVLVCGGQILRNLLMMQRLQQASLETVGALANAIEARDHYTGGHSERVGFLAALTGRALGLPPGDLQILEWAGMLHDVGKIGIPESILNKPGSLTPDEFEQIKQHPRLGFAVLAPVSSLRPVLEAVLYHHENFDGSGYPEGLRGDQIPMPARILHTVDIFDALTSSRSYRERLDIDQSLTLLAEDAGRTTDPIVTAAFMRAFREYQQTQPEDCRQRFAHA